ncbi:putative monooxygenase MoxC [compost metagenome]
MLSATAVPGTYEEIVRLVIPHLQKRGLVRKEYGGGGTLRGNLGLRRPRAGDWKANSR